MEKVTLVIPAFNEERNIARVLQPVAQAVKENIVDEVIVVDDGSKDKTCEVVGHFGYKKICLTENSGKGAAIKAGVDVAKNEIILIIDADLNGLTVEHIKKLLEPMRKDSRVGMVIGLTKKHDAESSRDRLMSRLSGQRAVKRELLEKIDRLEGAGYGTDVLITGYAKKHHIKVKKCNLVGVTQALKEQKRGPIKGAARRIKMFGEIAKVFLRKK